MIKKKKKSACSQFLDVMPISLKAAQLPQFYASNTDAPLSDEVGFLKVSEWFQDASALCFGAAFLTEAVVKVRIDLTSTKQAAAVAFGL